MNRAAGLATAEAGDTIIVRAANGTAMDLLITGTPVDSGTYWTIPVSVTTGTVTKGARTQFGILSPTPHGLPAGGTDRPGAHQDVGHRLRRRLGRPGRRVDTTASTPMPATVRHRHHQHRHGAITDRTTTPTSGRNVDTTPTTHDGVDDANGPDPPHRSTPRPAPPTPRSSATRT